MTHCRRCNRSPSRVLHSVTEVGSERKRVFFLSFFLFLWFDALLHLCFFIVCAFVRCCEIRSGSKWCWREEESLVT